jgi:hypothetical protein
MSSVLPIMRAYFADGAAAIDYRTEPKCVPFIHEGRCFDDVAHQMAHDAVWRGVAIPRGWLEQCRKWLHPAVYARFRREEAQREEYARRLQVAAHQPDTTGAERLEATHAH